MRRSVGLSVLVIGLLALPVLAACGPKDSSGDGGKAGANAAATGGPAGVSASPGVMASGDDTAADPGADDGAGSDGDAGSGGDSGSGSDKVVKGKGGGTIRYSGNETGSVTFGSANCGSLSGKLAALLAPDDEVQADFKAHLGVLPGDDISVTFQTNEDHQYMKLGASGVKIAKKGGSWAITFTNTKLGSVQLDDEIVINGTVTCGRTDGT